VKIQPYWLEEVYSYLTGRLRGVYRVRERRGQLLALIGSRWCTVERQRDGRLVEVWLR